MFRVLAAGVAIGLCALPAAAGEMVAWSYSGLGSVEGEYYVSGVPYTALETERGATAVIDPATGHGPATGFIGDTGADKGVRLPVTVTLTDAASGETGTFDVGYVLKSTSEDNVYRTLEPFDPFHLNIGGNLYSVAALADGSTALQVQVGAMDVVPVVPPPAVDPVPVDDTGVDPIQTTAPPPAVPEPATALLALAGLAGLAARRFRRA